MTLRTSNIFWILLLYAITEESISFSISRLCFNFPKNQDVASFIQSVSSTIRDSPKNLLDLASLTGADGSQLQPPIGGGGGDYFSGEFLNGANREWEKGLFAMPFIKKNDTTSSEFITYLSAIEANRYGASRGATDRGVDAAVKKWWARNTLGSKGLLIYLFPALYSQIAVLRTAVPFFLDRLSQYLQPIYMGLSFLLLQKRGASIIQATLWSSVLIGLSPYSEISLYESSEKDYFIESRTERVEM